MVSKVYGANYLDPKIRDNRIARLRQQRETLLDPLYVDHHFTKRFDAFVGIAYSYVSGGLAIAIPHGPGVPYNYDNNCAPTVGGRFTF
jgi:hypothetical protein